MSVFRVLAVCCCAASCAAAASDLLRLRHKCFCRCNLVDVNNIHSVFDDVRALRRAGGVLRPHRVGCGARGRWLGARQLVVVSYLWFWLVLFQSPQGSSWDLHFIFMCFMCIFICVPKVL